MHPRSIGKRIRMDEPPPPEYDTSNPMTPMDGSMADSQEPYTPYTPYQSTAMDVESVLIFCNILSVP